MIFNNPLTLRIHKPAPTVTTFTITNALPTTRCRRILSYVILLIRCISITAAICLIYLKFQPKQTCLLISLTPVSFYTALDHLSIVAGWFNEQGVLSLALFTISVSLFSLCEYREETFTVIENTCVVVSSASIGWWGCTEEFGEVVMLDGVEDILIHEGFSGSKEKLAIMVRGKDELTVIFPILLPDRKTLDLVGKKAKELLGRRLLIRVGNDVDGDEAEN